MAERTRRSRTPRTTPNPVGRRRAQVTAASAAGIGIAGAAASAALLHRACTDDHGVPTAGPYGIRADETLTVVAEDGVNLHVEIDEPEPGATDAARVDGEVPTVVLAHGYTLDLTSWAFQRADLAAAGYRVVTYDQRGHGLSGESDRERCTIDQLGRDLRSVVDHVAPTGPLVLVGHSMGGMSVESFAGQFPEVVAERVVAVGLVATSAGGMGLVTIGLGKVFDSAFLRLGPGVMAGLHRRQRLFGGLRRLGRDVEYSAVAHYGFGRGATPDMIRYTADMIMGTPLRTTASFLPHLDDLDVREALAHLQEVEVLVLNGSRDRLTPPGHSDDIVRLVPHARHVVVPGAGHIITFEAADVVNRQLRALIERGARRAQDRPRSGRPSDRRGTAR